jgi:hypothetical protein
LPVIKLANAQTPVCKWLEPESENLSLKLDWFQANPQPIDPADSPP